jgi:hypothetical protein
MAPHVATHKTHQRLQNLSFVTPKRLLQQYLPIGGIAVKLLHHVWRSFPVPTQSASYTKTVISPRLACAMSP